MVRGQSGYPKIIDTLNAFKVSKIEVHKFNTTELLLVYYHAGANQ